MQPDPMKVHVLTEMPPLNNKKRIAFIIRYSELPEKILAFNCRSVHTTKKAHNIKIQVNIEQSYQSYTRAKAIIKMNMTMAFYNEKEQLYIEGDILSAGLGPNPLQMRDSMSFPRNEAPNNAVLQTIAFMSKTLTKQKASIVTQNEKHQAYSMD